GEVEFVSSLPTVSIQTVSDEAMKIANRVDLSFDDKLKLGEHIRNKCYDEGYPSPALELILGMPGSTLDDFYKEIELMWNFRSFSTFDLDGWSNFRHDYMILPDSELNSKEYHEKYKIETVEVYSDIVDEDGIDNEYSLFKNKKTYFKTIRSCYSFTHDEMIEMWIMNQCAPWFLKNVYSNIQDLKIDLKKFGKICWRSLNKLPGFEVILEDVKDILNPDTHPRSIRKLHTPDGEYIFRVQAIENLLNKYKPIIDSEIISHFLINN
ncbi:MAG: hypothetical protein O3B87_05435, partial [bacterium]|nr:hypothetical protein [bacterium]